MNLPFVPFRNSPIFSQWMEVFGDFQNDIFSFRCKDLGTIIQLKRCHEKLVVWSSGWDFQAENQ